MATSIIATLQPTWDCRWSRPGRRTAGVTEALQRETRWVCEREGHRRNVSEEECQTCAHWEMAAEATVTTVAVASPAASAAAPETGRALDLATRAVMAGTGVLFAAGGFVALTSLLMIPVTVSLWMGAAALVTFAAFGRFGDHGPFIPPEVH